MIRTADRGRNLHQGLWLVIFAVLSLDVVFWFPSGRPLGWGDSGLLNFFYDPSYLFHVFVFPWSSQINYGQPAGNQIALLPSLLPYLIGRAIGLSYVVIQGFVFWFIQWASMTLMWLFLCRLVERRQYGSVAAGLGAILYNVLPLATVNYWYRGDPNLVILILIPGVMLIGLEMPMRSASSTIFRLSVLLLVCAEAFWDASYIPTVAVLGLVSVGLALARTDRGRRLAAMGKLVGCALVVGLISCWFLVPVLLSAAFNQAAASAQEPPLQDLYAADLNVTLGSLVRGEGMVVNAPAWLYRDPLWRFDYVTLGFVMLSIAILAIAASGIMCTGHARTMGVGMGLWLAGIVLSLGAAGPGGSIFVWMFTHIPEFTIFRNPANKFIPFIVVGLVICSTLGALALLDWIDRPRIGLLVSVALSCLYLGYGFPMLTGGIVDSAVRIRGPVLSSSVRIPADYLTAARTLDRIAPAGAPLLSLPLNTSTYSSFKWSFGYDGADFQWAIFKRPVLSYTSDGTTAVGRYLETLQSVGTTSLLRGVEGLGVDYVIVHNDVVAVGPGPRQRASTSPGAFRTALSAIGATEIFSSGKLDVYRLTKEPRAPIAVSRLVSAGPRPYGAGAGAPTVRYREINPCRWEVEISGVERSGMGRFLLTLRASYNSGWHAVVSGASTAQGRSDPLGRDGAFELGGLAVPSGGAGVVAHLRVDSVNNGWLVTPAVHSKTLLITLYYGPDIAGSWCVVVSVVTSLLTLLGAWVFKRKPCGCESQL